MAGSAGPRLAGGRVLLAEGLPERAPPAPGHPLVAAAAAAPPRVRPGWPMAAASASRTPPGSPGRPPSRRDPTPPGPGGEGPRRRSRGRRPSGAAHRRSASSLSRLAVLAVRREANAPLRQNRTYPTARFATGWTRSWAERRSHLRRLARLARRGVGRRLQMGRGRGSAGTMGWLVKLLGVKPGAVEPLLRGF